MDCCTVLPHKGLPGGMKYQHTQHRWISQTYCWVRKARYRECRFYLYKVQEHNKPICGDRGQIVATLVGVCLCMCVGVFYSFMWRWVLVCVCVCVCVCKFFSLTGCRDTSQGSYQMHRAEFSCIWGPLEWHLRVCFFIISFRCTLYCTLRYIQYIQ